MWRRLSKYHCTANPTVMQANATPIKKALSIRLHPVWAYSQIAYGTPVSACLIGLFLQASQRVSGRGAVDVF
jgi:hypothetical protein